MGVEGSERKSQDSISDVVVYYYDNQHLPFNGLCETVSSSFTVYSTQ